MGQIIKVYSTEALALAGGSSGLISSATVDSNAGAIHNSSDSIPYYIYNRYYYRIEANEPVSEFHIDWDDGENNSPDKRNIQIIKLDTPSNFTVVDHIYTEAKRYFPLVRVKSMEGFLSKFYTNDSSDNSFTELEPSSLSNGQNDFSQVSLEKTSPSSGTGDLIPHFLPSNLPPIASLRVDKKRVFAGIDNRPIDNITTANYPLLYAYTSSSNSLGTDNLIKLTVQTRQGESTSSKSGAVRTFTLKGDDVVLADNDLDDPTGVTSDISTHAVPFGNFNNSGSIVLTDCANKLLKAELLNVGKISDTERIYIKVFAAVGADLSGNADVSDDESVCVLSNGNPIVDLNDPHSVVNFDGSESLTKSSDLDVNAFHYDDDSLSLSTIQAQASLSSNIGQMSDTLSVSSSTDSRLSLSFSHNNLGYVMDDNNRFLDYHRLIRLQVADNNTITTGQGDIANRRSLIEHYEIAQYVSTVNGGVSRIPTAQQTRGYIALSNNDTEKLAQWRNLTTLSRTNGIMMGGSGDYTLQREGDTDGANAVESNHPNNFLFMCKTDLFDRVFFRTDNTYTDSSTATEVDVSAFYSHADGWKPLEIVDDTQGLKTSGGIKFKIPSDWAKTNAAGIESGTWSGPISGVTGTNASPAAEAAHDPNSLWDFSAYGVIFAFNAKTAAGNIQVKTIWPYSNSHSQLIRVVDGHHVSLNNIAIAQSISFKRNTTFQTIKDRFGKSEIRKIGANGGSITFGSVDLGDTDSKGNRKKIKEHQQNATPVFLDVTHKSGEKTRFFGVITQMSEDHPTGLQFPKYAINMQISHIIELNSSDTLISDKISIGGNIDDTRKYLSTT